VASVILLLGVLDTLVIKSIIKFTTLYSTPAQYDHFLNLAATNITKEEIFPCASNAECRSVTYLGILKLRFIRPVLDNNEIIPLNAGL